ncbi:odorant receptor 45a-like [Teleopsis dalmanni]|uniref:odorant receptor 45a-like n=1 Tax=Teleopsis dalmanni TaxID=139649 RepID=UPI0018CDA112|nr:odorant receptor 45a-like [Teleopsis dalmanni]
MSQIFGMKRYFAVQRFTFAAMGIDPTSEERIIINPVLAILPFFASITLLVSIITYTIQHISNVDEATDAMSPGCQVIMSTWKFAILLYKRKELVRIVRKIMAWNLKATAKESVIIVNENKIDIFICTYYHLAVATTGSTAIIFPLVLTGLHYIKTGEFLMEAPIKANYFMDYTKLDKYIFIYAWTSCCIYCVIYASCAIDTIFFWFIRNICAQFQILHLRFREAAEENNGKASKYSIQRCIHNHREALELAQEFNNVFGPIIFMKFAISCIQLCCLAFQCSRDGLTTDAAFHALFIMSVGTQLLLYCHGGQRMRDESLLITTAIFTAFKWQKLSTGLKKILLMPMMRAQKPCHLSGVFFDVDLSLYVWVLRTAGSYITMLWTLDAN